MKKQHKLLLLLVLIGSIVSIVILDKVSSKTSSYSEQESAEEEFGDIASSLFESEFDRVARELADWKRPDGPFKVTLQAGHWKANEAPEEFPNLRSRTGTSGGGKSEWQVNLEIAQKTQALLRLEGIEAEILPATVPVDYWADLFISIHADGNLDTSINGYKAAAPRRDLSGRSEDFVKVLEAEYKKSTELAYDPNVTRNMRGYYAFNWRRYDHAIHPKTTGVILETGFLSNAHDRQIIVNNQQKAAEGIVNAIMQFKNKYGL
jgi:hypothetical protein